MSEFDSTVSKAEAIPLVNQWMPLGWSVSLENIGGAADIAALIQAERATPIEIVQDLSLRAKVIDACGLACTFCHNEGTPVAVDNPASEILIRASGGRSGRVSVFSDTNNVNFLPGRMESDDVNFVQSLEVLSRELGYNELHLTGGEPSLHPRLPEVIKVARKAGYRVSMTSNGERGAAMLQECATAGLEKINFSIFGTTAAELASVQHERFQNEDLANKRIQALHEAIQAAADNGIKVAANIVMGDASHAERVMRLIDEFDPRLDVRILPDLSNSQASIPAIYQLLIDLGAKPVMTSIEAGSSNARVKYSLPNGRLIHFKQIRPTRLEACEGCEFNNSTDCKEGYYGARLYVDKVGKYLVGICLQRMDLASSVEAFVEGDLKRQILKLRQQEFEDMAAYYGSI